MLPTIAIQPSLTPTSQEVQPTASLITQGYPPPPTAVVTTIQQSPAPPPQSTTQAASPEAVEATPSPTLTQTEPATQITTNLPSSSPSPSEVAATLALTFTPNPAYPGPQATGEQPYPGAQQTENQPYPGPQVPQTPTPYSISVTSTATPTLAQTRSITATSPSRGTITASPTPTVISGTPAATPTELPPRRPILPPPSGGHVSIWLSWNSSETEMLRSIIQSFQKLYPGVTISLQFIPLDDLFSRYQEASYFGHGPGLLLGPASWGPSLFSAQLVTDLSPYVPSETLASFNPAALDSGRFEAALVSLPLEQSGVVMFRNAQLIPESPATFAQLSSLSHAATRAGNVGSYLDRGAYFSAADILGLGGEIMDDSYMPTFNGPVGLEWINLLQAYDEAGAVTFNTNRDLDMFKHGRVGLVLDGTWNITALAQAIGADNLAIDPWPSYGDGHLSGWVEADSVFLNANAAGIDQAACLAFIGYLLDPNVQLRLAEVGHIPSVMSTKPRDPLLQQAMAAFADGVPYPITVDASILDLYWNELNTVIADVFVRGIHPQEALNAASDELSQILLNSTPAP